MFIVNLNAKKVTGVFTFKFYFLLIYRPVAIDLQLPCQNEQYEIIEQEYEPPVRDFKEKTVATLGEEKVTFKKRRIGSNIKHSRQRLDED